MLTIFFDLSYGVLGGLAIKFLLMIPYFKKPLKMEIVKLADMSEGNESGEAKESIQNLRVKLSGKISFLNVFKLMKFIDLRAMNCDEVILDMEEVENVDLSAVDTIVRKKVNLTHMGKTLRLENLKGVVGAKFLKI